MDPLSDAQKGKASPFLINVGTVNKSLSILRKAEKTLLGKAQDKTLRNDPVGPTCRILVRNDTGSTLLALSCVEIGDPTISAVNAPFELMRHPMFAADTPTASDVAFAITEEPIPAGQYGRAVVLGVVPCDLNVTDTGHGYAAPVSGSTVLTSAATGPARILWSEGGTGTQKAVILIDRQGSGGSATAEDVEPDTGDDTLDVYAITADNTWQDTGHEITLPDAGTYLLHAEAVGRVKVSSALSGNGGIIAMQLYDSTNAEVVLNTTTICVTAQVSNLMNYGSASILRAKTVSGATTIKLRAARVTATETYTTSELYGATGSYGHISLGYVKLT